MRVRCSGPSKSHCLPTAIQSTAASRRAPTADPGDSPGTDFLRIQDLSCSEDSSDPYHFNYNPAHYWRGEIYMKRIFGLAIAVACMLWTCAAYSQVATGTISGTVRDNSGAVLPGVTVVIQNHDTGISRTVLSNEAGYYSAPSLGVGQYGLMVSLPGFQTVERTGITLTVGREAVVDIQMNVGAGAQAVEVSAEAPLVSTTNSSVSFTVGDSTIRELPLNGRDVTELVLLNPGVSDAMVHSNADKY